MLYRDIAYLNGPLSPYFNSLVFRILGVSLMSLAWVNIAILAGVTLMLHRLTAAISDEFAATAGTCALLTILAIGQPGHVGNYNFVTPYSHEMTHGLALSLGGLLCLKRYAERGHWRWIAMAGALVGLTSLTKPEIFLASSIALGAGAILAAHHARRFRDPLIFAVCAAAIPLIAVALLTLAMPARQALMGTFGAWRWALDPRINSMPFYQRVRGTFEVGQTLRDLVWTSLGYAVLVTLPLVIGQRCRSERRQRAMQFFAAMAVVITLLLMLHDFVHWEELGQPLILVAAAGAIVSMSGVKERTGIVRLVFAMFALLLLAKTVLQVRLYHYGFVLTAPALMLAAAASLCWLPAWMNGRGGSGAPLRGAALAAFIVTAGTYVYYERMNVQHKTIRVGSGADAFYAQDQGAVANQILAALDRARAMPPSPSSRRGRC